MPSTISIITPWSGETSHLLPDYFAAVQGAHVVTVDNASGHTTATALVEMTTHLGGEYIRNAENRGFAAANNQGYAAAKGDIIIFLNSDVAPTGPWLAQVAADVRDGALYGPSLAAQLVAGRHIPYLEGWCIAATRATWERLKQASPVIKVGVHEATVAHAIRERSAHPSLEWLPGSGPWDADAYHGPYWEDNGLCLHALSQDIALIQTQWSIAHKGGQTAGPIMRHGESFARNERTFTERALALLKQPEMTETWQRYMQAYYTQSDIQHHIGLLYSLAKGNVLELGTRTGVSTAALLAGVEAHGGRVVSVDIDPACAGLFDHPLWAFWEGSSTDADMAQDIATYSGPFSLLLVDSEHTVEQVTTELAVWAPYMAPGGTICIHDPETFPGVRRAVRDFCAMLGWNVTWVLPCNGMAVVEVPNG